MVSYKWKENLVNKTINGIIKNAVSFNFIVECNTTMSGNVPEIYY